MEASFTRTTWGDSTLRFHARVGELSEDLWVRLPQDAVRPSDDAIAVFFAILGGPGLESLEVDVSTSQEIADAIERFSGCPLTSERSSEPLSAGVARGGHALSFSGGFDSLAALSLLPEGAHLISMDFGGWFEREREFFVRFEPHIVSTNFRAMGFGRRSWLFMLSGVVLLRDHLDLASFTTGAILESSPWNFQSNIDSEPAAPELLEVLGMRRVHTVNGLTEVATTMLAMRHFASLIEDSLRSLAAPGSGKLVRKQMLVTSLYEDERATLPSRPTYEAPEKPPLRFGESLADDMLMPYMVQHSGEAAARALMEDIPDEMFELASDLKLSFYERYHPGFYRKFHPRERMALAAGFAEAGIDAFGERDWSDWRRVVSVLRHVHELPL